MKITHEGRNEKVKIVIFATLNKYHMSVDEFHFRMEYDGRVAQWLHVAESWKFVAYHLSKFY